MDKLIKHYIYEMQSGKMTDKDISKELNITVEKVRELFIKYNKNKSKKNSLKELVLSLDLDPILSLLNYIFGSQ